MCDEIIYKLENLLSKRTQAVISIEGKCATGKSFLAKEIATRFGGNIVHTDDFFLQPYQRTEKRFMQPGGNIDYERLKSEVIDKLKVNSPIIYKPFICKELNFGSAITINPKKLCIIEGSYSLHPYFGNYFDIGIYISAEYDVRLKRISERGDILDNFISKWIPLENKYFEICCPEKRCQIHIDTTDK